MSFFILIKPYLIGWKLKCIWAHSHNWNWKFGSNSFLRTLLDWVFGRIIRKYVGVTSIPLTRTFYSPPLSYVSPLSALSPTQVFSTLVWFHLVQGFCVIIGFDFILGLSHTQFFSYVGKTLVIQYFLLEISPAVIL